MNRQQLDALQAVVSPTVMSLLESSGVLRTLNKGESFQATVLDGEWHSIAYLVSGALRVVYYDEFHNSSIADYLFTPGAALVACTQARNECRLEALTQVELIQITIGDKLGTARELKNGIVLDAFQSIMERHMEIAAVLRNYDTEKRYHWFLSRYHGVDGIESHRNIAAFLGVAPETLSRVRARIRKTTPTEA